MTSPLVSIIMPAYNAGKYIAEAIQSVRAQTHKNWELLICDDGSTDGTVAIISSFKEPRIRFFTQPHAGVSAARNLAMGNMLGDYFCFLDADDVLPPNSLTARLEMLERDKSLSFAD